MVERRAVNADVTGSNPVLGALKKTLLILAKFFILLILIYTTFHMNYEKPVIRLTELGENGDV